MKHKTITCMMCSKPTERLGVCSAGCLWEYTKHIDAIRKINETNKVKYGN